ncbi:MAG: membrane protein insertion efficiency factor YidD [Cellvibrionaceae bacterium]|nr:membrane protein insertion efficiency factor YidD [Cellvibrionaceae bacterium]MCV6627466.1 membrane protein insertion efficiency factor YidD [Cellvibrionaceae bacterium]
MKPLLLGLIRAYQYLASPWVGNQCRFYPSCSHYAYEAIQTHGSLKGSWLTIVRLGKCHPWHPGGIDPVPKPSTHQDQE